MSVTTYEAVVENGQIRLEGAIRLPEKTKVFVVVPQAEASNSCCIASPRLVHPGQVGDFVKEIIPDNTDAEL